MSLRSSLFLLLILCVPTLALSEMMSVSFSGAEIRMAPSASASKVIFVAPRYYPLQVTSTAKEYYQVEDYLGRSGYIHKALLKPVKSIVITGSKANVRLGPGTKNNVVFQMTKGETAKLISKSDGWVEIKTAKNEQGWVADFLVWGE